METQVATPARRFTRSDTLWIAAIALAKLALNVAFHGRYGYFRDELYYMACSDHLAWGYVDQPPFSIGLLAITRTLLGDSLYAIRFPAALAGAATVLLTGLMARKLGGGRFAQLLAAAAAALSPVVLGNGARYFSMNAFDLMFWALGAYVLMSILVEGREKLWLVYGLVAGLGVMNKYSVMFFGLGTFAGILLTAQRRGLARPWIWLGGLIAAVIVSPHAVWEIRHGFPTREFIHNASVLKNAPQSAAAFAIGQAMETGFGQTLLWLLGLGFFFSGGAAKPLRAFGWMYVIVAAVMVAGNSKAYYLTPIYFPFLAAGALVVERLAKRPRLAWSRWAAAAAVVIFGLVALPFAVPVLPVDAFVRYERALGHDPKPEERTALADLPQYYADMFGWEEMVEEVARIYGKLTPGEKQHCVIYVRNYGEAAAIDFFGRRYGLPHATCAHNSYWYWAEPAPVMRVAIVLGGSRTLEENVADLKGPGRFLEADLAGTTRCEHCMPFENHRMIFVCRKPTFRFADIWEHERHFI
jgi:dolichyl-phosphate-mannose-protein mannosyltransferase